MTALIKKHLPGLDDDQIAAILEEVLPTPEETSIPIDASELRAVLGADAVILEARQEETKDPTSFRASMNQDIAEQAAKLRRKAAEAKGSQAARAPGPERHWTGKGGAHWSSEVFKKLMHFYVNLILFLKSSSACVFLHEVHEINKWLPPSFQCGLKPRQDSWSISHQGKHLAKCFFFNMEAKTAQ
jgi:hypothetical protein